MDLFGARILKIWRIPKFVIFCSSISTYFSLGDRNSKSIFLFAFEILLIFSVLSCRVRWLGTFILCFLSEWIQVILPRSHLFREWRRLILAGHIDSCKLRHPTGKRFTFQWCWAVLCSPASIFQLFSPLSGMSFLTVKYLVHSSKPSLWINNSSWSFSFPRSLPHAPRPEYITTSSPGSPHHESASVITLIILYCGHDVNSPISIYFLGLNLMNFLIYISSTPRSPQNTP